MTSQLLSSSYPPTNSLKRCRTRPRKNPHPLATRSVPLLNQPGPSSGFYGTTDAASTSTHSIVRNWSKSKSQLKPKLRTGADQVVPLDFSVRRPQKRSSVIAFGSNESDTENMATAGLATASGADGDVVTAQMLREQCQATLDVHLRAQLLAYFNFQQHQLQQVLEEPEQEQERVEPDGISAKKRRQESPNPGDNATLINVPWPEPTDLHFKHHDESENENEIQYSEWYHVLSGSPPHPHPVMAKKQRLPRKKNNVNGIPVGGSGRAVAVARRRKNAASGHIQPRPCSVNNSLNENCQVSTVSGVEAPHQQIFVNYELLIDDHFRRSLGSKKYRELFPSEKSSRNTSASSSDAEDEEPVEITLE